VVFTPEICPDLLGRIEEKQKEIITYEIAMVELSSTEMKIPP